MNNEFTRMQKLAGILTESYNTHSEGMHGDSKEDAMEGSHKGKMKVSEFKKKLKEAILAEKALKEDIDLDSSNLGGDNAATMAAYADMDMTEISYRSMERMDSVVSRNDLQAFLFSADKIMMALREDGFDDEDIIEYLIGLLPTPSTLSEAKKKKKGEEDTEEVDIDLGTDGENIDLNLDGEEGMGDTKVDMNMDTTGDVDAGSSESKKAFSELTDAYRAAKELGDEKLIRQIANTITYFNKNIILSQG
jgi:hypothetical protein